MKPLEIKKEKIILMQDGLKKMARIIMDTRIISAAKKFNYQLSVKGEIMKKGEKLVIVGCSGAGGPAAMMAKKLMPDVDVMVIRKEKFFIVR